MYIVLLGAPGSGKGTQGGMLSKSLGIKHLSTGELFRNILANPLHRLYDEIKVIKEGKLVSDEVVNEVIAEAIKDPEYKDGITFDGYPRTVPQAMALDKMLKENNLLLNGVIDLNVSEDVLLKRLLGRRQCANCKAIYHVEQGYEKCPECGGPLIVRADDREEVILERFKEYRIKTDPLHEYYREHPTNYVEVKVDDFGIKSTEVNEKVITKLKEVGLVK